MKRRYLDFLAKLAIDNAHPGGHRLTEKMVGQMGIQPGDRVLDVGCGTGATSAYLADKTNAQVTAIDLHPKMVDLARKRAKHSENKFAVLQASAEKLPFPDGAFQWVFSESVTAFTDLQKSLPEYFRMLAPDGELIAIEMTAEHELQRKDTERIRFFYDVTGVYTEEAWVKYLQDAGFAFVEILKNDRAITKENGITDYQINVPPDRESIDVWLDHLNILQSYQKDLSYRIFRAKKQVSWVNERKQKPLA